MTITLKTPKILSWTKFYMKVQKTVRAKYEYSLNRKENLIVNFLTKNH